MGLIFAPNHRSYEIITAADSDTPYRGAYKCAVMGFGNILASTTLNLLTPLTRHLVSTTVPILAVPAAWLKLQPTYLILSFNSSSDDFELSYG